MYTGAVIIAAGPNCAPLAPAGNICVAQRMIAAFQKAGVNVFTVITGPEDKKLEKQLTQPGVIFLHNPAPENLDASIKMGLESLREKCSKIFLLEANRPVISPDTLEKLFCEQGDIIIPTYRNEEGRPVLLSQYAAVYLSKHPYSTLPESNLQICFVPVHDPGVILSPSEICGNADALSDHDRKLTRPVVGVSITRGRNLLDDKLMMLLFQIQQTQSVRLACSRMQISYSTAWNILNNAEEELGYPLLKRNKGGPSGSGSLLTQKGQELLDAYEQFQFMAKQKMEKLYNTYLAGIL